MLKIQRQYNDEYIIYDFIGSINKNDLEKVENMLNDDISKTYAFIFSFRYLNYIDADAVKMLQKIYVVGINSACEMIISGLNAQPEMMLEIFQTDRLYMVKKTLKDATNMFYGEDYEIMYSS
ncbi:STAS domain-containing protein [Sulfurimonas sp.]|uniref:STAS domain-containing protein n=1 Tax=Sulfurimonas sp. TaxID=2022749 RepID=UPI0025DFEC05|nr:STAS domain-containing protein [Sulfurimonas sp.]